MSMNLLSAVCRATGHKELNVAHKGGIDNYTHYLAAPMLVIMEPMFPTMVATTITPTAWLLLCWLSWNRCFPQWWQRLSLPLPGCSHVVIMEPMFPTVVAKTISPTTWLLPCSDHGANVSHNGGKNDHLAAPMLVIMEPMFPRIMAKTITWLLPCWWSWSQCFPQWWQKRSLPPGSCRSQTGTLNPRFINRIE
jgi:hypothetical protein